MNYKYTTKIPTDMPKRITEEEETVEQQMIPFLPKRKPYQHYEHTYSSQHVHFYLSEGIGEASDYTDMIHRMLTATENDVIFVHLNTPGGQLDTGVQILNAMQNTAAHVITVLESTAYSLGTLIFLAGDEMVVNDNCMMMFHNFRGGFVGTGHEMIAEMEAHIKWFASLAKKIYVPFLSEEEFDKIARGEDLWLQSPDIRKRLQKAIKLAEEEAEKPARKAPAKRAKKPTTKEEQKAD